MSTAENLWGEIPTQSDVRAPVVILREQASKLSELTNMLLLGNVEVARQYDEIVITLSIIAPSLQTYTYEVLRVVHGALMYPVKVFDVNNVLGRNAYQGIECDNEADFKVTVTEILRSDKVRQVIASLLAQTSF